jgi:hypothetical protein
VNQRIKISGKKISRIIFLVFSLGACLWISFNYLIWFLPPQPATRDLALADLDGDGDLDAFLANGRNEAPEPNTVLWNDGQGNFRDSGQRLGDSESWAVALEDFDSDGDIDALISNIAWGEYFWNEGNGTFQRKQSLFSPNSDGYYIGIWRFKPADLNADTRLDLFLAGCCGGGTSTGPDDWQTINAFNSVWLSDGKSLPRPTGQKMGLGSTEAVDLGDVDGDGDMDVFVANSAHLDEAGSIVDYDPNEVWLNDGDGIFSDSGQRLGDQRSYSIALGDLDDDSDLDAFVGNLGPDEIWLNDSRGRFTDNGQRLGNSITRYVYLADLDDDGDLDAFVGSDRVGQIWFNDGGGTFKAASQKFQYSRYHAVTLGDVDGNGTIDIIAGRLDTVIVWYNDGMGRMTNRK